MTSKDIPSENLTPENNDKNIQEFNKFLKNNQELLQEKYKEYFIHDSIKITNTNPPPSTVVKFISDIFLFDQSPGESITSKVQASLMDSFQYFLKNNKSMTHFTFDSAISLLKFCIESNQLFAVQYQASNNNKEEGGEADPLSSSLNHQKSQNWAQNLSSSAPLDRVSSDAEGNINEQKGDFSLAHNHFDGGLEQNQFNLHEEIKLNFDPIQVKRNLKIVFDFYCKQQMALSPLLSFDRIQQESSMLTMGKMIMMARMMNMLSPIVTKEFLISKFRKVSSGKREIDFKKFQILMSELQIQDPIIIARAELNAAKIQPFLKTDKKPFDTQDMMPRELIKNREFVKKLTMHSGKMEEDLYADTKIRRSSLMIPAFKASPQSKIRSYECIMNEAKSRYRNSEPISHKIHSRPSQMIDSSKLTLAGANKKNYSQQIRLMSKIVPTAHDDDQWLSDYKLPVKKNISFEIQQPTPDNTEQRKSFEYRHERNAMLIRDLKNRVKQMERQQSNMEETKPYIVSPSRRN